MSGRFLTLNHYRGSSLTLLQGSESGASPSPLKRVKTEVPSVLESSSGIGQPIPPTRHPYVDVASQKTPLMTSEEIQIKNLERELTDAKSKLGCAQRENAEQKQYIFSLSNRLSAAQVECDEFRHSARAAAVHRDDFVMQRNLRHENYLLKDQLANVRKQQKNLALIQTNSLGPSERAIQDEFDQIRVELKDACSSLHIAAPSTTSLQDMQMRDDEGVVGPWAQRLAQCSFLQLASLAVENGVSGLEVVRSLAAVGVCDLVFESDFPHLMAKESPILDQYRKHMLARGKKNFYGS